ncbi:type VII secretion-associated serine protease mycosin [Amycolatopsis sp. H20-H5]|uniref:type VII secretion-associated serine protease mycosin n=1 Tax=Amycolatopsis sp. H20-H5 TaxID=3046309 RepID=UPI002DB85EC7|nr:type VII secretion-associated serine protease mycosin [Amycolatopsis sp. H20-H5]MEC3982620.1 type VII secretion-associated serine protease mycosin [Amycolatopsis sp. H20-H5]
MKRTSFLLVAAALALAPTAWIVTPALAAPPTGACTGNVEPAHPVIAEQPWAQRLLDLKRVWPHSTGAGTLVAVIDSGVDVDHPQLAGKVLPGRDFFLVGSLPGNFDCTSHGTAVASIVDASQVAGVGFAGVAPDARVLPVRVTDRSLNDGGEPTPIDPDAVGKGIRYAADEGAKVINLSLSGYGDYPVIRDAVRYAQSKDALIVAAAGNRQENAPGSASYPAAYEGVLGVGAIDISGARDSGSQVGGFVDLVAPGKDVVAAARVAGHEYWDGTSFAAPFVSGAAALVRSAWPKLTAPQVAQRLVATASLARGGQGSPAYGAGVVDPYRAVTEGLSGTPDVMPAVRIPPVDLAAVHEQQWWSLAGTHAKLVAAAVGLGIALAAFVAWVAVRGRRRRWSAARTTPPLSEVVREEPPEQMFLFPKPEIERQTTG